AGAGGNGSSSSAAGGAAAAAARDTTDSQAAPSEQIEQSFIELELVDTEQRPVAFASYSVTDADGNVFTGMLDADGRARIDGVAKGSCKVTFPDFHDDEWSAN
ncbi:MAG TPA: hypothetical protein VGD80_40125, partial [Kofleriaceae bacterium]